MARTPRMDTLLRRANGVATLLVTVAFGAHALLRAAGMAGFGVPTVGRAIMWAALGVTAVHAILSMGTTWAMWTDPVRPASPRKKAHQVRKWVTGGVLTATVAVHALVPGAGAPVRGALMVAAAVALYVHAFTGVKSLTKDLALSDGWRMPLRVALIALCAVACGLVLFAVLD